MARPRTPVAKAEVSGAAAKNPQRHRDRKAVKGDGLGEPSVWMLTPGARTAWEAFRRELPWLKESHRSIVEIAACIRGRLIDGEEVGITALNQLRLCLAQLGGTPADESKIHAPAEEDEQPEDAYFN